MLLPPIRQRLQNKMRALIKIRTGHFLEYFVKTCDYYSHLHVFIQIKWYVHLCWFAYRNRSHEIGWPMSHFEKRKRNSFFNKTLVDTQLYISMWQLTHISKEEESGGGGEGRGERELAFHSETLQCIQSYAMHSGGSSACFTSFP